MEQLKFDEKGLVCAIAQDYESGEVLMQAYMNEEAYKKTLETGYAKNYGKKGKRAGICKRCAEFFSIAIRTACF